MQGWTNWFKSIKPMMNKKFNYKLYEVLSIYENLHIFGFSWGEDLFKEEFLVSRNKLITAESSIKSAMLFLLYAKLQPKILSKGNNFSSYSLKHVCERWLSSYISNGVMITAALMLNWKVKAFKLNINATIYKPKDWDWGINFKLPNKSNMSL